MHPGTAATEPAAVWPCDHARVSKVPGTQQGADSAHKEFGIRSLPRPDLVPPTVAERPWLWRPGWLLDHILHQTVCGSVAQSDHHPCTGQLGCILLPDTLSSLQISKLVSFIQIA